VINSTLVKYLPRECIGLPAHLPLYRKSVCPKGGERRNRGRKWKQKLHDGKLLLREMCRPKHLHDEQIITPELQGDL